MFRAPKEHDTMSKKLAVTILVFCALKAYAQDPKAHWSFDQVEKSRTREAVSGKEDPVEGFFEKAPGVRNGGLRLDGFTACLKAAGANRIVTGKELTVEAWISLGEYPWNWCPILTAESDEVKGYRLMVGPLGQASLECAIGGQWVACTSARDAIPLRTWMHVAGVYRADSGMTLYLNGEPVASQSIKGAITFPRAGYVLGMVARPEKPSDIHRTYGTLAAYFGLDGIMDEVKVYDAALPAEQIKKSFASVNAGTPDIAPRKLPSVNVNPGRFGAFTTNLKYYPAWDNLWPVDQDPDIVVCFKDSPVKFVFWRGTRYSPAWVSENGNWMTDQSVEAWDEAGNPNRQGCFEHMQDRHCRFSHVRIIENTAARVVVHWRYAPVSAYNDTWKIDPKTGWECWIDEYYFIYPDASAIRRVAWKKGALGDTRQFQETLALLHPGQIVSDLLEKDYVDVADYSGKTAKSSYVENPNAAPYGPFSWNAAKPYTIQRYNFKSRNKPFICFEPGNMMNLRWENLASYNRASGCNHFPVGQARCDGRTTLTSDKPSHCSSFPISDPVLHEAGDREFWLALYGMNPMSLKDLIEFGKSWASAPEPVVMAGAQVSGKYDRAERCYKLENGTGRPGGIDISLAGSAAAPVVNPALYIKNWNGEGARVTVNGQEARTAKVGLNAKLEGTDLVVFLPLQSTSKVEIRIQPR
jgi:hypothetical protein